MLRALLSCFSPEEVRKRPPSKRLPPSSHPSAAAKASAAASAIGSSNLWSKIRTGGGGNEKEKALAVALFLKQNGVALPLLDRSSSVSYTNSGQKRQSLPRSSSYRPRSLTDPLVQPQQLVNQIHRSTLYPHENPVIYDWAQTTKVNFVIYESFFISWLVQSANGEDIKIDDLESDRFVLVHGGGFGAWCWYKTIALLSEGGFKVNAIDLTGSGVHSSDTNDITSISQYVKPLTDFLEKLGDGEKVILVGHDLGGACISYAMEMLPEKVAKAVFITAAMLTSGQSTLDMFSQQAGMDDLMRQAQMFIYANGNDHPPTAIDLDKSLLKDLLFNQSPAKDFALASVSMRLMPFAPLLEKLSLSDKNYGSVRRFYIETTDDSAIPLCVQQGMCNSNPPERVFQLKGSDHSPFFSKPQALNRYLVEISKIPLTEKNPVTEKRALWRSAANGH